jgi:uncharacterized OB-fold protein
MSTLNPARVAREFPSRYRLEGARCEKCGTISFPARRVCPSCRGRKFTVVPLKPEGKVLTWTVIHVGPSSHKHEVPYALAVVELADGVRTTCQIADLDPAQVVAGMPVRLEFRRVQEDGEAGVIAYGHKAVPA